MDKMESITLKIQTLNNQLEILNESFLLKSQVSDYGYECKGKEFFGTDEPCILERKHIEHHLVFEVGNEIELNKIYDKSDLDNILKYYDIEGSKFKFVI